MSTLSERVREAVETAKSKGFSVADIATKCGISVQAVYQWLDPLNSLTEIKGSSLMGLASISGISPWYISDGTGEKILFYAKSAPQKATLQIMEPMDLKDQEKLARIGHTLAEQYDGTNGK